ncbi:Dyp-type peroxidase [Vibrio harveyi]
MSHPQTAIIPESGPVALYAQIKVNQNYKNVLGRLKALPKLVDNLNAIQPGAELMLSIAFTKSFWQYLNIEAPQELVSFTELGEGDTFAPASDVDILIHCHSTRHDLHFYILRKFLSETEQNITIIDETYGYRYLDSRDMTGFIDGTENPKDKVRSEVALVKDGDYVGGSYVMVQRFEHRLSAWEAQSIATQEKIIGRTKQDSIELDNVPASSHVGRVDIKEKGKGLKIVRHSLPYGSTKGSHGLLFISYCHTIYNFKVMLESMYGITDGKSDHLLHFTKAETGAYFFAPSQEMLAMLEIK